MSLATDVGSAPMQVGAVLLLDTPVGLERRAVASAIDERIRTAPRLRQRLIPVPFGCGRPIWIDDPDFAIERHVSAVDCPGAGDDAAVLELAAEVIGTPLPRDRPLWSATLIAGVAGERTALVIVFHHVLADGIGGLAVLANLVDGSAVPPALPARRGAPGTRQLAVDALRGHLRSIRHLPAGVRLLRDAVSELRSARPDRPPRSSLNRPTGARRRFVVVRGDVEQVHGVARAHGGTVNDVVLAAVGAALGDLLASRGEDVDRFVVSVPVSARRSTTAAELGNQVGVVPVEVPAAGEAAARLEAIAAVMRTAKEAPRGASAALLGPAFRILARVGLFQRFIDRQHLVNTFVTNLRGPAEPLTFLGARITEVLPLAVVTGNVTVSFAVLSYAGTLAIVVIADPDACPDVEVLRAALDRRLDELVRDTEA